MKIEFNSDNLKDLRTQNPILFTISQYSGKVFAYYQFENNKAQGIISLKKENDYSGELNFLQSGKYILTLKDDVEVKNVTLDLKEQEYLNFSEHMWPFTILLTFVLLGIYLWIVGIKKKI